MSLWQLWLTAFKIDQLPEPEFRVEFAFCGRSNAGKSTLINTLVGQRNLARTAKSPGKTRSINFYRLEGQKYIMVDLPGFGYAKVSKKEEKEWQKLMTYYFAQEKMIKIGFLLCDLRHGLTKIDLEALGFLESYCQRVDLIFTKIDKVPKNKRLNLIKKYMVGMPNHFHQISSLKREGIENLQEYMTGLSSSFN